ncbi:ankyrin repeat domain-containing protein [Candidatus Mesenet endosymbiont of Agriotes lineatus]|uniref:ankyrin repeat domain-containing protein n=1 Tax=Candidatus Mesenet endosymbiont of Agriotes lineatus TaxID=3077948 RepID=UPI0030D2647E
MLTSNQNQSNTTLNKKLFMAFYKHRTQEIENLLKQGADVNAINLRGNSPLHLAVNQHCSITTIQMLLKRGAKVNALNGDGNGPLHIAASKHELLIMDELVKNGADVSIQNHSGITPLELYTNTYVQRNCGAKLIQANKDHKTISHASKSNSIADVPTAETSLERSTAFEDQNLPLKKRKLKDLPNTQPSGELTIPNIPNKMINILEVTCSMGDDIV